MSGDEMNLGAGDEFMSARGLEERALEEKVLRVLELVPEISAAIPSDFAARVAAEIPERRVIPAPPTHYGRTLMWIGLVILFVALLVLAARGFADSPIGLAVEWTLCIQFLAIAVWMGTRLRRSS